MKSPSPGYDNLKALQHAPHTQIQTSSAIKALKVFYVNGCDMIPAAAPTVAQVLTNNKCNFSVEQLTRTLHQPCKCNMIPECCPTPLSHCIWRQDSTELTGHFSETTVQVLRQCMKNKTLHDPLSAATMVFNNVQSSLSNIPGLTRDEAKTASLQMSISAGLTNAELSHTVHPSVSRQALHTARSELKEYRVTKVDKNTGGVWVMCPVLWAELFQEHVLRAKSYAIAHQHAEPAVAYGQ